MTYFTFFSFNMSVHEIYQSPYLIRFPSRYLDRFRHLSTMTTTIITMRTAPTPAAIPTISAIDGPSEAKKEDTHFVSQ